MSYSIKSNSMLVKPITRVKDKLWELCSPGRSRPRLWQSHLPGFVPAAVASLGRNHRVGQAPLALSLSMASRPATSAAKAGMMEEAIAREGGEVPSILARPLSSFFFHSFSFVLHSFLQSSFIQRICLLLSLSELEGRARKFR